jgi:uncharacterized membrane protein YkoI
MKILRGILSVIIILGLVGCATIGKLFEEEKEVPLSEVPTPVLVAARGAVENIILSKAKIKEDDDQKMYILEGTSKGKSYEIDVSAAGRVLEVEQDD